jgi:hypothetical protein
MIFQYFFPIQDESNQYISFQVLVEARHYGHIDVELNTVHQLTSFSPVVISPGTGRISVADCIFTTGKVSGYLMDTSNGNKCE